MRSTEERDHIYRKTFVGILYNFGGKNIGFVLSFIFTILIARHLGPEDYGSYSFYRNTAAFLALFTVLGLDQTMNHFVPRIRQSGNQGQLPSLMRKGIVLSLIGIGCVSLFVILVFFIIPVRTGLGFEFSPEILLLFLALLIAITFSAIMKGVISGMFHQKFLNIVETGSIVSKLLLTLIFFSIGLHVEGVLLAVVLAYTFPSLLYYRHSVKEFTTNATNGAVGANGINGTNGTDDHSRVGGTGTGVREKVGVGENEGTVGVKEPKETGGMSGEKEGREEEGEAKKVGGVVGTHVKVGVGGDETQQPLLPANSTWLEMRKYAMIMIIFTASYIMLDNQVDIIMLKFLSGDAEAGYYNIAFRFAFINAMVFIGAIDGVLVPTFTSLKREDSHHQRDALHGALKYTLFFLIPAAIAGVMFTDQLIDVFFGEDYADSVDMLRFFYPSLVLSMALAWPIRYLMISIGWEKRILVIYVGYALLNVVGNLVLIPMWGGLGATVATGVTSLLITLHLLIEVRRIGLLDFPALFALKSLLAAGIAIIPFFFTLPWITNIGALAIAYVSFCALYLFLHVLLKGISRDELKKLWGIVREHGKHGGH